MTDPSESRNTEPVETRSAAPSGAQAPILRAWRRLWRLVPRRVDPTVAVLVGALLVLAVFWIDTRHQIGVLQTELSRRLSDADAVNREARQLAAEARDGLRDLDGKLSMLESRFAETQGQRIAIEALYQELSRNRDEWVLAEVEQVLLIASQQLRLAGNVKAALIALETADSRLSRADRAHFTSLRRTIRQDIERLRALPYVDVVGMSLRLDNLTGQVASLPLAALARPAAEPEAAPASQEGAWLKFARDTWQDIRDLVRIQSAERAEEPLLTPTQSYFLRENLRLRLTAAKVGLLASDEPGFRSDIQTDLRCGQAQP